MHRDVDELSIGLVRARDGRLPPGVGPVRRRRDLHRHRIGCPADAIKPRGTVCRAAAGDCDVQDVCSGADKACPDTLAAAGTPCRPAAGACDEAEACTGGSPACPPDAKRGATAMCRPAAGACDVAETCDGATNDCPSDLVQANGSACASTCVEGGTCAGGLCLGGTSDLAFSPAQPALTGTGSSVAVTITHAQGTSPIELTGATIDPDGVFAIVSPPAWPVTLGAGQSTTLTIQLTATTPGDIHGDLVLDATGCTGGVTLPLTGTVPPSAGKSSGGGGGGCSHSGSSSAPLVAVLAVLGAISYWRSRRGPSRS